MELKAQVTLMKTFRPGFVTDLDFVEFVMVKRLIIFFVLLAVASGVVSGTPLQSSSEKMMKCCETARNGKTPLAEATRLCCALNCSESIPSPSSSLFNHSSSDCPFSKRVLGTIATFIPSKIVYRSLLLPSPGPVLPRAVLPKYIRHNTFLI